MGERYFNPDFVQAGGTDTNCNAMKRAPVQHDEGNEKCRVKGVEEHDENDTIEYQQKNIEHDESDRKYQQKDIEEHDENDRKSQQKDIEEHDENDRKRQQKDIEEHDESGTKYQQKGIRKHNENETNFQQNDLEKHDPKRAEVNGDDAKKVRLEPPASTDQKQFLFSLKSSASDFRWNRREEQKDCIDRQRGDEDFTQEKYSSVVVQEVPLTEGDFSKKRYPAALATEFQEQEKGTFLLVDGRLYEAGSTESEEETKVKNEGDCLDLGKYAEDIRCQTEKLPGLGPSQKSFPASDVALPGGMGATEHDKAGKWRENENYTSSLDIRTDLEDTSDKYRVLKSSPGKEHTCGARSEVIRKRTADLAGPTEHDEYGSPREPTENEDPEVLQDLQPSGRRGKTLLSTEKYSLTGSQKSPAGDSKLSNFDQGRQKVSTMTPSPCESTESSLSLCDQPFPSHYFSAVDSFSDVEVQLTNAACGCQASDKEAASCATRASMREGQDRNRGGRPTLRRDTTRRARGEDKPSQTEPSAGRSQKHAHARQTSREGRPDDHHGEHPVTSRAGKGLVLNIPRSTVRKRRKKYGPCRCFQRCSRQSGTRETLCSIGNSVKSPAQASSKDAISRKPAQTSGCFRDQSKASLFAQENDLTAESRHLRVNPARNKRETQLKIQSRRKFQNHRPQSADAGGKKGRLLSLDTEWSHFAEDFESYHDESEQPSCKQRQPEKERTQGWSRSDKEHSSRSLSSAVHAGLDRDAASLPAVPENTRRKQHLDAPATSTRSQFQHRDINRQVHRQEFTASVHSDDNADADTFIPPQPCSQGRIQSGIQSSSEDENRDHSARRKALPRADASDCCTNDPQLSATRWSQAASEDAGHSVHWPERRGGEREGPPIRSAVHLRPAGQAAVTLQTISATPARAAHRQPVVDLRGYEVDMRDHLDWAEQGFTAELLSARRFQVRDEEGHLNISSPLVVEENAWTTLTTHFRTSGLYREEARLCCLCRERIANVILFNCHHVVVCGLCAREVEFCPLPECLAEVLCFMRIVQ